jgi:serine phosphatase RsbU (regulator of sigma subunit)
MARLLGRSGILWELLLRPALLALPVALFFHFINGFRPGAFPGFYIATLVFSLIISLCIAANTKWVAPRLSGGGNADRGRALVLEIASYAVASLIGSLLAAVLLHFTIAPGLLGSVRLIVTMLVWSVFLGTIFLALNYAIQFQHRHIASAEARARVEQEIRTAADIQQALLPPRSYEAPSCTAVGASIPCRTIGGDFFDYFDLGGDHSAFTLGDVAGKGPPAAILAAMVQGLVVSHVGPGIAPAETMDRLNRALLRRVVEGRFATLFYGCLEGNGRLVTCNAGHNPGFLFRAKGGMERLEEGGLMIGAFDFATYAQQETVLAPGDTLVLYSDGVTDAESPSGEQFGEERLLACLEGARAAEPTALLDHVLESVRGFVAGHPPADDVTVMVVRYGNGAPSASAVRMG